MLRLVLVRFVAEGLGCSKCLELSLATEVLGDANLLFDFHCRYRKPPKFYCTSSGKAWAGIKRTGSICQSARISAARQDKSAQDPAELSERSYRVALAARYYPSLARLWAFPNGLCLPAQGCEERATLGFRLESLWDSVLGFPNGITSKVHHSHHSRERDC